MRSIVSSSLFGFVVLAGTFALSACSLDAAEDPEARAADVGQPSAGSSDTAAFAGPTLPAAGAPARIGTGNPQSTAHAGNVYTPAPEPTLMGHACSTDAECESGSCADGVCCDTACDGACESCNSPGNVGFCVAYANGTDPEAECGTPACGDGHQESFSCDGSGACQVQIASCGEFACGETTCLDHCTTNADCAFNAVCVQGNCEPQ